MIETLAEDARGLRVVARVTHPTAAGLVARGALTGLSFGYRVRGARGANPRELLRSEEHTSELQSLMRISYAVLCLKKKTPIQQTTRCNSQSYTLTTYHYT